VRHFARLVSHTSSNMLVQQWCLAKKLCSGLTSSALRKVSFKAEFSFEFCRWSLMLAEVCCVPTAPKATEGEEGFHIGKDQSVRKSIECPTKNK
jgi:hypothetical protein